jgi:8-oxo-dGTP pyrophosphatase MutT (NUDIX family)
MNLKQLFFSVAREVKNTLFAIFSIKTLGARALVIKRNKVLLIRHTYMSGWYTIGGAVDVGESVLQAIKRELNEEGGISVIGDGLKLFNIYYSNKERHDDYVVFYICDNFDEQDFVDIGEIAEKKWFPLSELPTDISLSTKMRINEYLGITKISDKW